MEVEGQENYHRHQAHMGPALKRTLVVLNCLLMAFGNTGGPLLLRLYFRQGGHLIWFSGFLETAGFPILLLPIFLSYLYRLRTQTQNPNQNKKPNLISLTPRLFLACALIGLLTGLDDFLYAYGLAFLPVSTSSILISSQLAFTAFFAFLLVRQSFTPFSVNAVALLTVGAVVLGLHAGSDRPEGVTRGEYYKGLVLPLVELTYRKAEQAITYTLVMEMQLVMGFFATVLCVVGMLVNKDFQAIQVEAGNNKHGEAQYFTVLVWAAIFWQFFFLGTVGVIFCVNTLLAGIIIAVFIPVVEVLAVIFFREKFTSEKGLALALSLWGLASYSFGEYKENKEKKLEKEEKEASLRAQSTTV